MKIKISFLQILLNLNVSFYSVKKKVGYKYIKNGRSKFLSNNLESGEPRKGCIATCISQGSSNCRYRIKFPKCVLTSVFP